MSRRPRVGRYAAVVLVLFAAASAPPHVSAQAADGHAHTHPILTIPVVPDDLLQRPLPLRDGIGSAHDAVTTTSADAQRYYDQALAYMHGYMWVEAARSLHQALRLDAGMGMAHVALSTVYLELNQPTRAREALTRARDLAPALSPHDRQHLAAREAQMLAEAAPGDRARLSAYRAALDTAVAAFPDDVELLLWRGVAESNDPADRGQGAVVAGIPFFTNALARVPGHVGAHHYLTHAYENNTQLADALRHGAAMAQGAPNVPHAQHMYGHVLRRSGKIDEAVAAFERAYALETAYFTDERLKPEYEWHHEHNLDLLAASYRYRGQMQKAAALLAKAFDLPSSLAVQMFNKREWPEFLIARGRVPEAMTAAGILASHPVTLVQATGHIEAARAQMAAKRYEAAAASANAALRALRAAPDGAALVGPAFEAMQGEFFLRTGQREKGHAMLQSVVATLRAAPGPDNWAQTLFTLESIAQAARAADDWAFAGWAAEQMFAHDANYAGTHYAIALVAAHNNQAERARTAFARAADLWRQADADLPELRDVQLRTRAR